MTTDPTTRELHLNAFIMGNGHHEAAWRHPSTCLLYTSPSPRD